jgi:hypothetical protein
VTPTGGIGPFSVDPLPSTDAKTAENGAGNQAGFDEIVCAPKGAYLSVNIKADGQLVDENNPSDKIISTEATNRLSARGKETLPLAGSFPEGQPGPIAIVDSTDPKLEERYPRLDTRSIALMLKQAIDPNHIFTLPVLQRISDLAANPTNRSVMTPEIVAEFVKICQEEGAGSGYWQLGQKSIPDVLDHWVSIYRALQRKRLDSPRCHQMTILEVMGGGEKWYRDCFYDDLAKFFGRWRWSYGLEQPGVREFYEYVGGYVLKDRRMLRAGLRGIERLRDYIRKAPQLLFHIAFIKPGLEECIIRSHEERKALLASLADRVENAQHIKWFAGFYGTETGGYTIPLYNPGPAELAEMRAGRLPKPGTADSLDRRLARIFRDLLDTYGGVASEDYSSEEFPGLPELCWFVGGYIEKDKKLFNLGARRLPEIRALVTECPAFFRMVALTRAGLERILVPDTDKRGALLAEFDPTPAMPGGELIKAGK